MGIIGHRVHEIADRVPVPRTHLLLHAGGLGLAAASRVAAAAAGARGFAAAAFTGRRRRVRGLVQHRALPEPLPVGQLQRVLELSSA